MTLILPNAQGIASARPQLAGMLTRRRRRGVVDFTPIDARLARAQLGALLSSAKVSR